MLKALAAALLAGVLAGSARADRFVIVHGAFQTAGSWERVAAEIRKGGDEAVLVDLPGRDGAGDPKSLTLETYRDAVLAAIGERGPVILVGHSFGGFTISAVAEARPDAIERLVFVAAYVPASGESLQALAATDPDTKFTKENFVLAPDISTAEVLPRDRALIFANDAYPETASAIADALVKEPLAPMAEPAALTADRFGRVPKAYVRTARDHAVSPALQDRMIQRAGIASVATIRSGHSPQSVLPGELARLLVKLGKG